MRDTKKTLTAAIKEIEREREKKKDKEIVEIKENEKETIYAQRE